MKKHFLITFLLLSGFLAVNSQSIDVFAFSGYTFADKFPISGGSAKIHGGHTFGGSVSYNLSEYYAFEILYSRQESRATAYSSYLNIDTDEPISVNYILAGGNRLAPISDQASFYGGVKLGAVVYAAKLNTRDNITKFAAGLSGGFKYALNNNIGLRLQANLNFPIIDAGASLWWSPGSGVDVGVSSYTPIMQFGFTGGLVFMLAK